MLCFISKCFLLRFILNARQEKENSLKCSERTETEKKAVEFVSWHSLAISCQYIITLHVCSETFSLHWFGHFWTGRIFTSATPDPFTRNRANSVSDCRTVFRLKTCLVPRVPCKRKADSGPCKFLSLQKFVRNRACKRGLRLTVKVRNWLLLKTAKQLK